MIIAVIFQFKQLERKSPKKSELQRDSNPWPPSFTPLVYIHHNRRYMGRECWRYHSRLTGLISVEKGEDYAKTLTWIRGKVSFSILRSALLCLRGSRSNRRRTNNDKDMDVDVELARYNVKWLLMISSILFVFFSSSILCICRKQRNVYLYCL